MNLNKNASCLRLLYKLIRTYEKTYTGEKPKDTVPHQTQQQTLSNSKNHKKKKTEKEETGPKRKKKNTTTTTTTIISYEPSKHKTYTGHQKKRKRKKAQSKNRDNKLHIIMKRSITKEAILELSKQTNKGNATLTNTVFIALTSYYSLRETIGNDMKNTYEMGSNRR